MPDIKSVTVNNNLLRACDRPEAKIVLSLSEQAIQEPQEKRYRKDAEIIFNTITYWLPSGTYRHLRQLINGK
jgi:hypothetical protein